MGAQFSKNAAKGEAAAEKPGEAVAASPSKANGQVRRGLGIFLSKPRIALLTSAASLFFSSRAVHLRNCSQTLLLSVLRIASMGKGVVFRAVLLVWTWVFWVFLEFEPVFHSISFTVWFFFFPRRIYGRGRCKVAFSFVQRQCGSVLKRGASLS